MIKGLTEKEYSILKSILTDYNAEFWAYGSRVKGDFTDLSDLDLLVKSKYSIIPELKEKFDESLLPFIVNMVDFNNIDEKFYKLIEKDLVRLQ